MAMSNSFGKLFSFTTFGESHGEALGVVIDGMPSNIEVDHSLLSSMLSRRAPGQSALTTSRKEKDSYKILSGVFEGKTTGTPILVSVENTNQNSKDYSSIENIYRPGHADYTYEKKYGIRDYRGGGRSSGRETVARVIAGAFAKMALNKYGISIDSALVAVGTVKATNYTWNPPFSAPLYSVECDEKEKMIEKIEEVRRENDSIGCTIETRIHSLPIGLGDPIFDKLDALLSSAVFSIGAVKAFEVGEGIKASQKRGSENNDEIRNENGKVVFVTNNSGGILGGISNGDVIINRTFFKPTPSISRAQRTINRNNENTTILIEGRHDPCIGPRAVVVVEAMEACVILDLLLRRKAYECF